MEEETPNKEKRKFKVEITKTWILYISTIILIAFCAVGIVMCLTSYFTHENDNTLISATATFSVGLLAAAIQFAIIVKSGKNKKDSNIEKTIKLYSNYAETFTFASKFLDILNSAIANKEKIIKIELSLTNDEKIFYYIAQDLVDKGLINLVTSNAKEMSNYVKRYISKLDALLLTLNAWGDSGQVDSKMFERLFESNIQIISNIKSLCQTIYK